MHVRVVGAGVIGLSCAVRLLEAGHRVEVVARETGEATTSAVAAAMWYPYLAAPRGRVVAWGAATYAELCRIADAEPGAGVRVLPGRELLATPTADPDWVGAVDDLQRLPAAALPAGYADGWTFRTPVADMGHYLPWLGARVSGLGGRTTIAALDRLDPAGADLVVDAAGLGARELAGDQTLHPVRGQVALLRQVGLREWTLDDSDAQRPTYVIPRLDVVVCGGTAQVGDDDTVPDEGTAAAIVERCRTLVPMLREAAVVGHRVGLRPVRPTVRLERAGDVVHCYGHGGAGLTLSWGCADEVVRLVG